MNYFSKITIPKNKFIKLNIVLIDKPHIILPKNVNNRHPKNNISILSLSLILINSININTEFAKQNKNILVILSLL